MTFSGDIPFIIGWILSDDSQQELMTTKSISDLSMFIPSRQYSNPCKNRLHVFHELYVLPL